ncbi:MAG: homoserine O-succinyltransferase [Psychrosphaera sp.]|jgi:homoserine O-succinyltransferase|uniref:homoserine O-succinyltransferase n=1 Tax=Psychrosphaera sp. F3M07 TaxID=2841560 RepID=UPI001C08863E|nr:homoserine O-succinyltransferase [Psychrosphaera sp. F3M07]MBU2919253.1 homoserine O-succinyltransferase [Psychrosphaera sp. F3M07]
MPIRVPDKLPAIDALKQENIYVMPAHRADTQDIRPMQVAVLNLMPDKITTEVQLVRLLSNSPLQIDIELVRLEHQTKTTSEAHLDNFYRYFSDIKDKNYDGLIITGAPLGLKDYEDITYWPQLKEVLDWADRHVTSTLFLCWAAHAAIYYHYGIKHDIRDTKLSGVYKHTKWESKAPIMRGFDDIFYVPHSRYGEVPINKLNKEADLITISGSDEVGAYLMQNKSGTRVFITGHPEYDRLTLHDEYTRDVDADLNPDIPVNYYPGNDPKLAPQKLWQAHGYLLFSNWLNYYVYQKTPYNLSQVSENIRTDNFAE